jgi:hypothetical protein
MTLNVQFRNIGSMGGHFFLRASLLFACFFPVASSADSEIQKLSVEIRDPNYLTSHSGLAELPLPPGVQPGDEIEIELEPGTNFAKEWTFLKPYSGSINVPGQKQRYYGIVLVRRDYLEKILKVVPTPLSQGRDLKIDQFDAPAN